MIDAFEFGALVARHVEKQAFDLNTPAGTKVPPTPKPPMPDLLGSFPRTKFPSTLGVEKPAPPPPPTPATNQPTWGQFGGEMVNALNPLASKPKGTGTFATMDGMYNPWSQNKAPTNATTRIGRGMIGGVIPALQ